MEDLLSLLVIIFSLVSLLNKNAKKQMEKNAAKKGFRDIPPITAPQAVPKQPAAAPQEAMMPPRPEYRPVTPLEAMAAQAAAESLEGKTDHSAHISCEGHDLSGQQTRMQHIAAQETIAAPEGEEAPRLDLKFTGDELVHAFVMREILTSPRDRRRRAI